MKMSVNISPNYEQQIIMITFNNSNITFYKTNLVTYFVRSIKRGKYLIQ